MVGCLVAETGRGLMVQRVKRFRSDQKSNQIKSITSSSSKRGVSLCNRWLTTSLLIACASSPSQLRNPETPPPTSAGFVSRLGSTPNADVPSYLPTTCSAACTAGRHYIAVGMAVLREQTSHGMRYGCDPTKSSQVKCIINSTEFGDIHFCNACCSKYRP
jgi:hypothetical protein